MVLYKIDELTPAQIAGICDHTFLDRPESYQKAGQSATKLWEEGLGKFLQAIVDFSINDLQPYAVCVRPEVVLTTREFLSNEGCNNITIASVVGFPDGQLSATALKVAETEFALDCGATEIGMVLKYNDLKSGMRKGKVIGDIDEVMRKAKEYDATVKLILENSELTPGQIKEACNLARICQVPMIETSTGFGSYNARREDVIQMRREFTGGIKVSQEVARHNLYELLHAASGRTDGQIELDPHFVRIGEISLLYDFYRESRR